MKQQFILLPEDDYNSLNEKLDNIISMLSGDAASNGKGAAIGGKWITEKEAQRLTGKKATTLWKMRTSGELTFTKLNNCVYYDKESILMLLEKNKRDAFK